MEGLETIVSVFFFSSVFLIATAQWETFSVDDVISYLLVNRFYMAVETRTCTDRGISTGNALNVHSSRVSFFGLRVGYLYLTVAPKSPPPHP